MMMLLPRLLLFLPLPLIRGFAGWSSGPPGRKRPVSSLPMEASASSSFADPTTASGFPMAISGFVRRPGYGMIFTLVEQPRSVRELEIMQLGSEIRNKPRWWEKVRDPAIASRWEREVDRRPVPEARDGRRSKLAYHPPSRKVRRAQFRYALDEARWLSEVHCRNRSGNAAASRPGAVDGVYARDSVDDPRLVRDLLGQIGELRGRPAIGSDREDRHPGIPQMVDLVHPSLYCYERGKTPVLWGADAAATESPWAWDDLVGGGTEIPTEPEVPLVDPGKTAVSELYSRQGMQWLPAEFRVEERDGTMTCSITSYINNLHPVEFADMYSSLGELFCQAVPLLEDVLGELGTGGGNATTLPERPRRVPFEDGSSHWYADYPNCPDDFYKRTFLHPEIPEFSPPRGVMDRLQSVVSLRDRPLQVVVKVASLELDPEGDCPPRYDGGNWHVEGMLDDRIVATACCYLEGENTLGGELEFRTAVDEKSDYEQDDYRGSELMYGLEVEGEAGLTQPRGYCTTTTAAATAKILAWPNTLQHRVKSVRLADPERPGKRTIVCFFLCDPTLRVRSTATVPPQQSQWRRKRRRTEVSDGGEPMTDSIIPREDDSSAMTYIEACKRRNRLIEERSSQLANTQSSLMNIWYDNYPFYSRYCFLCEH